MNFSSFSGKRAFKISIIKFININNCSNDSTNDINLINHQLFNPVSILNKDLTINMPNGSYKFNSSMIKDTSSMPDQFDDEDITLNIKDENNVMGKVEQLYNGEPALFSMSDILVLKEIISILKLQCFPYDITDFNPNTKFNEFANYKLFIDKNSFIKYLQKVIPKDFSIITRKAEYKCNFYGVASSNAIMDIVKKNPNSYSYNYDFEDKDNEFQLICNFFNYESIQIRPKHFQLVKKISQDLQIVCLSELIDILIKDFMFTVQIISNERTNINSISQLFEYLINRKNLKPEIVNELIVNSKWSQTIENVEELSVCIIQVIRNNARLHPFLLDLVLLLDKSYSENNQLNHLLPFLTKNLLNNFGSDSMYCSFIYRLHRKSIISMEDITEVIRKSIQYNKYISNTTYRFEKSRVFLNVSVATIWFFPELKKIKNISFGYQYNDAINNFMKKYIPDNIEKFIEMRESGEPDDELTLALRKDDVDKLKSNLHDKKYWSIDQIGQVPFNIFEPYFIEYKLIDNNNKKLNLIDYSVAYGSCNCIKYLISLIYEEHSILNPPRFFNNRLLAFYGQNKEIIEMSNKENASFNNLKSTDITIPIILKHQNCIYDDIYDEEYNSFDDDLILMAIDNGNIDSFIKFIDKGFRLASMKKDTLKKLVQTSSQSGFYELTKLLFELLFNKNNTQFLNDPFQIIQLEDSVYSGNLSIFKLYTSFNIEEYDIEKALTISIVKEHFNIIKYMFETEFRGKFKITSNTALKFIKMSFFIKKMDIYNYLITQFVDREKIFPEFPYFYGDDSLLSHACHTGNFEYVKMMAEFILKKNSKVDCTNSIVDLCSNGFIDICQYLFEKKVSINFYSILNRSNGPLNIEMFSMLYNYANSEEKEILVDKFFKSELSRANKDIIAFFLEKNVKCDHLLIKAVETSDIDIVKLILKYDSSPSFINDLSDQGTALNIAVEKKNIEIIKLLLSLPGIDPSLYSKKNKTPLITACDKENYESFDLILNFYGDSIQSQSWQLNEILRKFTLSYNRCYLDTLKILKRLLMIKGLDLNYHNEKHTLLTYVCEQNNKEIVSILINSERCDVNLYQQSNGNTALMYAIEKCNFEIVELLIKSARTDINQHNFKNETALMIAIKEKNTFLVDLIINDKKFDPIKSRLDFAFAISNNEMAKKLIQTKGLNVNYKYTFDDMNYIDENFLSSTIDFFFFKKTRDYFISQFEFTTTTLINSIANNNLEKIEMIIRHQTFDPIKSNIKAALFYAVSHNNVNVFKRLLPLINNGINIHSPTGDSLLMAALKCNSTDIINEVIKAHNFESIDIIEFLPNGKSFLTTANNIPTDFAKFILNHGIDPDLPDSNGVYPLQNAILNSMINIIDLLINTGKVDLRRKILYQKVHITYLHLAAAESSCEVLKKILSLNVININEIDSNGDTPLMYAFKYRKKENIKVLFEKDDLDFNHINYLGKSVIDVAKEIYSISFFSFDKTISKNLYLTTLLRFFDE